MGERSVLVTGASGVLGWNLCRFLQDKTDWSVAGTYCHNRPQFHRVQAAEMDLLDSQSCARVLKASSPEVIIHSAALTRPDDCERDQPMAYSVNVTATRRLLDLAPPDSRFIYISTDLVFDGEKGCYSELDEPNPVNYYGETKLQAESLVRKHPGSVVVRIAKLFSHGSPFHSCFTNWMRENLVNRRPLKLFTDQFRTPISVFDVSRGLVLLVERGPSSDLYHLGGPERLSRYAFGLLYAEVFGLSSESVAPVSMADLGLVPRGRDCSLVSTRFNEEIGFAPLPLKEGLAELMAYASV
jgi:dTDP-4-dehydrorhamnose reductase